MYENRNHASDSVIGNRLSELQALKLDPYQVAQKLQEEGYELSADGSGWVLIRKGGERCHYPLMVTELPNYIEQPAYSS